MSKRYRAPKVKPGEIKVKWGRIPGESTNPELCYYWGEGVSKRDINLLHYTFNNLKSRDGGLEPLLAELEARGYDTTTFKFSISKRLHFS